MKLSHELVRDTNIIYCHLYKQQTWIITVKAYQTCNMKKGIHEVKTDQEPIEYGESMSLRIPSCVVPQNMESLDVKVYIAFSQSFNYLRTQWKRIAIQFCTVSWFSATIYTLHAKSIRFNINISAWVITSNNICGKSKTKYRDLGQTWGEVSSKAPTRWTCIHFCRGYIFC